MLSLVLALTIATLPPMPFVGSWIGTLTYRDFGTNREVVLPTKLNVIAGGNILTFAYVYDDGPGKIVRDKQAVQLDPRAGTFRVRDGTEDDVYRGARVGAFVERGRGKLVLSGTGRENGSVVAVRETIDLGPTALIMRREVRPRGGIFFTRHVYRLTRRVSAAAFRADARILRAAYQTLHPGLYRYATSPQTAQRFAQLDRAMAAATTIPQAYLAVSRYTASVRCGHSYPNFFNQPDALGQALFGGTNRVPFYFAWLNGRMIVTRNLSGNAALAPGTKVVSINGFSAAEILSRLLPIARADGSNDAKRIDQLQVTGSARYEAFDVYFPLVFPTNSTHFDLRVQTFGATRERALHVDAQTDAQRYALVQAHDATVNGGDIPLWTLRKLDARIGYLRMPTWSTYNSRWDWKRFLQHAFSQLAAEHTANVIVDLRGNEGGTDVGPEIIAHLIGHALPIHDARRLVRYRKVPRSLAPYLDTWDASFKDWGRAVKPLNDRFFELANEDDTRGRTILPLAPRYNGHVWVLVDASNSSATFEFDQIVQKRHLATLVGSPTGGNERGINGGAFFFVRLPNSEIEVDLPLIGVFPKASMPDAGIRPSIRVERTAKDIAGGRDTALDAILMRIHERAR